jgi:PAS domain S-box-containing protein
LKTCHKDRITYASPEIFFTLSVVILAQYSGRAAMSNRTLQFLFRTRKHRRRIVHDVQALAEQLAAEKRKVQELSAKIVQISPDLSESDFHSGQFFEFMHAGFMFAEPVLDSEGNPCDIQLIEVNQAFRDTLGISKVDIQGKTLLQLVPWADQGWIRKLCGKAPSSGPVHFQKKSPSMERWFSCHIVPSEGRQFACLLIDITEHKRTQEELEAERKRLATVLEQLPVGVVIAEAPSGDLVLGNQQVEKICGHRVEESKPFAEYGSYEGYHVDGKPYRPEEWPLFRAIRGEVVEQEEIQFKHANGSVRWMLVNGAPILDGDGNPIAGVIVFADITDRKHARERLQQLTENLEREVAERTELAETRARQLQSLAVKLIETEEKERKRFSNLLHNDLQQILASARLHVQAAGKKMKNIPELADAEKLIEESLRKSRNLSHQLSPSVLHHSGIVPALRSMAGQMDEQFGLHVQLSFEKTFTIDRGPLELFLYRAVQELLFNVVKHAGVKTVNVSLHYADCLVVTVSDKGKGFDVEAVRSLTSENPALGLLSIQERARYMGGDLKIESTPGKGSSFTLTLPSGLTKAGQQNEIVQDTVLVNGTGPVSSDPGTIVRVLIADDHQVMRQGLNSIIEGWPEIEVVGEAENGREAVDMAGMLQPDVIIMDVSMPIMDGIEATRFIKNRFPNIRILGLTMYEDTHIHEKILEAGADAFISKGESTSRLLEAIYGRSEYGPNDSL